MAVAQQSFIRPDEFWQDLGLRGGQTVVHLGCGAGYYLVPAAQIVGRAGKVYGIDVLTNALEETENKAERAGVADIVHTVRADLENNHGSSLPPEVADWTLVANILYQAIPEKILEEARRVTKRGGTVVVVEWQPAASSVGPPSADRLTKNEVLDLAQQARLKLIKEFKPSPYHYGLLLAA